MCCGLQSAVQVPTLSGQFEQAVDVKGSLSSAILADESFHIYCMPKLLGYKKVGTCMQIEDCVPLYIPVTI